MLHERRGFLLTLFHGAWQTIDTSRKIAVNLLFVASEMAPYAKTGGLADVMAALPAYVFIRLSALAR